MTGTNRPKSTIDLQERDLSILRDLFEARVMTSAHLASIYFDRRPEAAKKRLQKLKASKLICERPRRVSEPAVLFLTRKGLTLLRDLEVLALYPALNLSTLERRARVSDLTIRHELEVMDVKCAFHVALRETLQFNPLAFTTWPLLNEFRAIQSGYGGKEVLVKPDGFVRIHETEKDGGISEHTFFLELDRSTETQDTLIQRAGCYLDYYKSGGFALRNDAPRSAFKEFPFRVLMVMKTAERRNNTIERLLQSNPPILTMVYLSTLDEVKDNPLGTIWVRPIDCREATKGTRFDPTGRTPEKRWGYQRQTERDLFLAAQLKKQRLFSE